MKRNYRCVSANQSVRCRTFSTLEKAKECILQMIRDDGEELDHINDDSENGWIDFVTWNDWCYCIVDIAKRDKINSRPFDY